MDQPSNDQARIDAAFEQIAAIIRRETHNDASIIRMISGLMEANLDFAKHFSQHVAEVLDGHTEEVDYTEVVVQAYCKSLSSPYTNLDKDVKAAEEFADWMTLMTMNSSSPMPYIVNATHSIH